MSAPLVSVSLPDVAPDAVAVQAHAPGRRRIHREAGQALEILGHAIEYLTDEYLHEGGSFIPGEPQLDAIQLLMALNRQVYFACPEAPTFRERVRAFFR